MSESLQVTLANGFGLIYFVLLLIQGVQKNKDNVILWKTISMLTVLLSYLVRGCLSVVATMFFAVLRNACVLRFKGRKGNLLWGGCVAAGVLLSGCIAWQSGNGWMEWIPAVSFLWCSLAQRFAKNALQVHFASSLDAIPWILYHFSNTLVSGLLEDFFNLLLPLAVRWVQRDPEEEPASADTDPVSYPTNLM